MRFSILNLEFSLLPRNSWFYCFSTRAINLPARAFNLATRAFSLLSRGFELATHGFELVTRNSCFAFSQTSSALRPKK